MNTLDISAESLAKDLGVTEVPDVFIVVAKHQVAGFDSTAIAQILSCEDHEVQEVLDDQFYKEVKGRVAAIQAEQNLQQSGGWDALENMALEGLTKRIRFNNDPEFLLKVAAVANRAQRRVGQNQQNVLDPGLRAGRTTITLTQRLVEKIKGNGDKSVEQTKQLSISDGTMVNPSFSEIDDLLSVKHEAILPKIKSVTTHDVTADEIVQDIMSRPKA